MTRTLINLILGVKIKVDKKRHEICQDAKNTLRPLFRIFIQTPQPLPVIVNGSDICTSKIVE